MTTLKEGDTYRIETLDDLINCPINMMSEAIAHIAELHLKRIDLIQEREKGIEFKCVFIEITNDGIDETTMNIRETTCKQ